jgi:hypothetical protein
LNDDASWHRVSGLGMRVERRRIKERPQLVSSTGL